MKMPSWVKLPLLLLLMMMMMDDLLVAEWMQKLVVMWDTMTMMHMQ
jgi:hypothetical protein